MKALLRKDFYTMDQQMRLLIVLALALSLVPIPAAHSLGSTYAVLLAYMMPLNVISYDEKCKWDKYAAMLPYTPRQIVLSKYLLSYLLVVYSVLVQLLGQMVEVLVKRSAADPDSLIVVAATGVVCVLMNALCFPIVYRFGAEKGRFAVFAPIVAVIGAILLLTKTDAGPRFLDVLTALPPAGLSVGTAVLLAALSVLSFYLSVRFYCRRRSGVYG